MTSRKRRSKTRDPPALPDEIGAINSLSKYERRLSNSICSNKHVQVLWSSMGHIRRVLRFAQAGRQLANLCAFDAHETGVFVVLPPNRA
jgi:hypothetical protein